MNVMPLEQRPTFQEKGLNYRAYGLFTRPLKESLQGRVSSAEESEWIFLEELIDKLKSGHWDGGQGLLSLSRKTEQWNLRFVALGVVGCVGDVECFKDMRKQLEALSAQSTGPVSIPDRTLVLTYCQAFARWGRLDVVPFIMDQFLTLKLRKTAELGLLPLLLADLLVDDHSTMIAHEPPEHMLEEYLNLVMNEYDRVVQRLGSEKANVFQGQLFSVRGVAERMRHLSSKHFASDLAHLRERFEPATGIDCSAVFTSKEGTMPLRAAVVAEDFLESEAAERFEPGKRYFFGREVPG